MILIKLILMKKKCVLRNLKTSAVHYSADCCVVRVAMIHNSVVSLNQSSNAPFHFQKFTSQRFALLPLLPLAPRIRLVFQGPPSPLDILC